MKGRAAGGNAAGGPVDGGVRRPRRARATAGPARRSTPGGSGEQRRLGGRYRLVDRIGTGASADVWRAVDERDGGEVAVKLLHPHLLADPVARARFESEARAAQRLRAPGIVAVRDVVVDDAEAALVMDLVPGGSLAERLARDGTIPEREAASIAAGLADALHEAHRLGVVHRDVKPDNVLLELDGRPRLADFGIARSLDDAERLTMTGTVMGSLRYMAPEQLAGEPPGPAGDVFALGAVLYEMLAGRPAFDARSPGALIEQQRRRPPAIDGVDPGLATISLAALRPDPSARIETAEAMSRALRAWLGGERIAGVPPEPEPTAAVARVAAYDLGPGRAVTHTARRRSSLGPRAGAAIVALVLAVGAAGALIGWRALAPGTPAGSVSGDLGKAVVSPSPSASASRTPSPRPSATPRAAAKVAKVAPPHPARPHHGHRGRG